MAKKEVENFLYFDLEYEDDKNGKKKKKTTNSKNKRNEKENLKENNKNEKREKNKYKNKDENKKTKSNNKKIKNKTANIEKENDYDELEIEIPIMEQSKNKNERVVKKSNHKKENHKIENENNINKEKNRKLNQNENKKKNVNNPEEIFNLQKEFVIGVSNKNSRKKTLTKEEIAQIRAKREVRNKKIKTVLVVGLITFAIFFTLYSPLFNITEIKVINNKNISQQEIISLSGIQKNENTFKLFKGEIINKIKENPYIENVSIRRILPGTVQIEVSEREAAFMLEYANAYVYINTQGYILEISAEKRDLPIITGFATEQEAIKINQRLCLEDLKKINTVLKIINVAKDNNVVNYITKIDIADESNYILILDGEGKKAYIGDCSDLITRILYVKDLIEKEKGKPGEIFVDKNLNTQYPMFRETV